MKNAYLIMAHNEKELLKLLIEKLDDENNLLFIHLDKKMDVQIHDISSVVKKSKIIFIKRMNIMWGGYSQIKCEMMLLKEAVKHKCDYYHLLTGSCLPVKDNKYINDFFEEHFGEEFITFDEIACSDRRFINRVSNWHFFIKKASKNNIQKNIYKLLNFALRVLEKIANTFLPNRVRKLSDLHWMKGSAYFDITDDCARYILEQEKFIKKNFKFTSCSDEVFIHTLVFNSKFKEKINNLKIRYIDWVEGESSPLFLTEKHIKNFNEPNILFARKFSLEKSLGVIKSFFEC